MAIQRDNSVQSLIHLPDLSVRRIPLEEPDHAPVSIPLPTLKRVILTVGLAGHTLICWNVATYLWEGGDMIRDRFSVMLVLALYAVSFALLITAASRKLLAHATWLILAAALLSFVGLCQITTVAHKLSNAPAVTDVWLFNDYAGQLARSGVNPYSADLRPAYLAYHSGMLYATPTLNGDFTGRVSYPALAFLLHAAFQTVGLSTQLIYPLFSLLTLLAMFFAAPDMLRPVVLLALLIDPRMVLYPLGWVSDGVWAFFLVMMVATWKRPRQAAIFFGLACAFKQQPWLIAPFLLIRLWRENRCTPSRLRLERIFSFGLISGGVFLLFNAPYILWDFPGWMNGVLEPLATPMIVLGQGLSSLTMSGILMIPKTYFTLLVLLILVVACILYWRHIDQFPEIMWLLPGMIFWFNNRSLTSYWYFFLLPFALALARSFRVETLKPTPDTAPGYRPRVSLAFLALIPVAIAVVLILAALRPSGLSITVQGKAEMSGDRVNQLTVQVANHSGQRLVPRFSVQSWNQQAFFWHIDNGPEALEADATALYTISADTPETSFYIGFGAQVIVSDANGYDRRASTLMDGDSANGLYGDVPNGTFQYWDADRDLPHAWGLMTDGGGQVAYNHNQDSRSAVKLSLPPGLPAAPATPWATVMLDTYLPLSKAPFTLWVNPPPGANAMPSLNTIYGVELVENTTRVWVLFGDSSASGQLVSGLYFWTIPTPRGTWSQQRIDPAAIFAGLNLQNVKPTTIQNDLNYPVPMLNVRLLLAARHTAAIATAEFGSIASLNVQSDPTEALRDLDNQPEQVALWRANTLFSRRNYDQAVQQYARAIGLSPNLAPAYAGFAESHFALGDWATATDSYTIALNRGQTPTAQLYNHLGWAYLYLGRTDDATSAFQAAFRLASAEQTASEERASTYTGMGTLLSLRGECTDARAYFDASAAVPLGEAQRQTIDNLQAKAHSPQPWTRCK